MKTVYILLVLSIIPARAFADDSGPDKLASLNSEASWEEAAVDYGSNPDVARGQIGAEGEIHLYKERHRSRNLIKMEDKIIKVGIDFAGQHDIYDGTYYESGLGVSPFVGTTNTNSGATLSGEFVEYLNYWVGLGGGITYQAPRRQIDYAGYFNFVPIYFLIRLRSMPVDDNVYRYFVMHLGFNIFSGDSDYKGPGGSLSNGGYWAFGGGVVVHKIQVELLYTVNTGSISQSGFVFNPNTGNNDFFNINANLQYSTLNLSLGYNF